MGSYMSSEPPKTSWAVLHQEVIRLGDDVEVELNQPGLNTLNFQRCKKNPNHTDFIPVTQFSLTHLPIEWQRSDIVCAILDHANRTVKVNVHFISPHRPPNYPFSDYKGRTVSISGSGFSHLGGGWIPVDEPTIECPLQNCNIKPHPHRTTTVFLVLTAKHVVFDDIEALNSTIEFFYDSADRSTVVTGQVVRMQASQQKGDFATLECVSHDLSLFGKVRNSAPPPTPLPPLDPLLPSYPLAVIISHPHGCEKYISLGKWVGHQGDMQPPTLPSVKIRDWILMLWRKTPSFRTTGVDMPKGHISPSQIRRLESLLQQNPEATLGDDPSFLSVVDYDMLHIDSISYTAATCPGSSGAFVLILDKRANAKPKILIRTCHYAHRKGRRNGSGKVFVQSSDKARIQALMANLRKEKTNWGISFL